MAHVFQYGSNLSTTRLNHPDRLHGDARVVDVACTQEEHELVFDLWSTGGNCAAADIIPGSGRKIWGVIYEIPDHLIQRATAKPRKSLDAIEAEGSNYQRVEITLQWADGTPINRPVLTYIGLARKSGIRTSLEYVRHILDGLEEHRIPADYVQYVRARIVANNPDLTHEILHAPTRLDQR